MEIRKVIVSVVILGIVAYLLQGFIDWAFINATWVGKSTLDCDKQGACWAVIYARWDQIIYGFYPKSEQWRVNLVLLLLPLCFITLIYVKSLKVRLTLLISLPTVVIYLLYGGLYLKVIPTDLWGGLFLSIALSVGSMLFSFPIAVLLALGRNSTLLVIKPLCVAFIEIIRGVPLISILFLAAVMFPLFISADWVVDNLLCIFIGIALFQAAYLAEVIRAGLNSVPKGQIEAAASLGLSYRLTMFLVVLPQALRTAIPGIVNSFIALFKDTTLVLIVGIYDFLGIVQAATTDPKWLGTALEAYLFCALVYWIFCFSMSSYSKYLEKKLRASSR